MTARPLSAVQAGEPGGSEDDQRPEGPPGGLRGVAEVRAATRWLGETRGREAWHPFGGLLGRAHSVGASLMILLSLPAGAQVGMRMREQRPATIVGGVRSATRCAPSSPFPAHLRCLGHHRGYRRGVDELEEQARAPKTVCMSLPEAHALESQDRTGRMRPTLQSYPCRAK